MAKTRSVVFSTTRRKLGHGAAFYQITLEAQSIARKRTYQRKNNLVVLPPFLEPSIKFQRNRLPNDQDLKCFNVRPSPKFCLIDLFLSSLSPAALKKCSIFERSVVFDRQNVWVSSIMFDCRNQTKSIERLKFD